MAPKQRIPAKKPNILMIVSDQLVPMLTGPYGNRKAVTPNMDRLAARGVLFENAYTTCPVCVPARYSLLTGRYLAGTKAYDNGSILPADEPTHNHYLNIAGYDTVLAGKAHFIGPDQLHGFSKRFMTNVYPANFHFMPKRRQDLDFTDLHPNPIAIDYIGENVGIRQWSMEIDYDEEAVFHAIKYLATKKSRPAGTAQKPLPAPDTRPFFLQVSLNHPHEPFHVLEKYWNLYEGAEVDIPRYPDNMEDTYTSMDRTLIKLHGSELVDLKNADSLRRLHRAYLELAGITDYLPMDGRSLLPQLRGERDADRPVFCENYSEGVTSACFMVRKGRYKYTYIYRGETQLFDLAQDPEEWNNLSGSPDHREVEQELKQLILSRFDPGQIDREAQQSYEKRAIVARSMEVTGLPGWNYRPSMDVDHMFWRTEEE